MGQSFAQHLLVVGALILGEVRRFDPVDAEVFAPAPAAQRHHRQKSGEFFEKPGRKPVVAHLDLGVLQLGPMQKTRRFERGRVGPGIVVIRGLQQNRAVRQHGVDLLPVQRTDFAQDREVHPLRHQHLVVGGLRRVIDQRGFERVEPFDPARLQKPQALRARKKMQMALDDSRKHDAPVRIDCFRVSARKLSNVCSISHGNDAGA